MKNHRLWLAAALIAVAFPVDAGERITIAVTPRQSFGPTNLRVRVRVEPNADNRTLEIVADSGGYYRSSQIQLDGVDAPRTVSVEFRSVPGGEYEVSGVLLNGEGRRRATARQHALVLSPSAEDDEIGRPDGVR